MALSAAPVLIPSLPPGVLLVLTPPHSTNSTNCGYTSLLRPQVCHTYDPVVTSVSNIKVNFTASGLTFLRCSPVGLPQKRCSRARRAKPSLKPFSSLSSPPTQMLLPPEPGLDYTISLASSPDTPAISNPPLSSTFFQ